MVPGCSASFMIYIFNPGVSCSGFG